MCLDSALSDVSQNSDLLGNGWQTNSTELNHHRANCDADNTLSGWAPKTPVGAIYTTFQGTGTAVLSFGNCFSQGTVKALLNGNIICEAMPGEKKEVSFDYSVGNELVIVEYGASVWKLHSITVEY